MQNTNGWNWEPGRRKETFSDCEQGSEWLEEWHVSPDGEKVACVACTAPAEFTMCVNGKLGETVYEKVICPKFTEDGKLAAYVSQDMEWFVYVDGQTWEEGYGFAWDLKSAEGHVATAVQQDMKYGMAVDGKLWETMYENANNFTLSPDGSRTAAAVQVEALAQADIYKFQEGVFKLAVDGELFGDAVMNVYSPTFSPDSKSVACEVRTSLYDYSIAVDGKKWATSYNAVWAPAYNPVSGAVVAPVRVGGKWGLAENDNILWQPKYSQLWKQRFTAQGDIWAVCAPSYGEFTLVKNDTPWNVTANVVYDVAVSPDGQRAAAVSRGDDRRYKVMSDNKFWPGSFEMIWRPVFSSDSSNCAARVDMGDKQTIMVNGKAFGEEFDECFDPAFSPDGSKVLVKARNGKEYHRIVVDVNEFK